MCITIVLLLLPPPFMFPVFFVVLRVFCCFTPISPYVPVSIFYCRFTCVFVDLLPLPRVFKFVCVILVLLVLPHFSNFNFFVVLRVLMLFLLNLTPPLKLPIFIVVLCEFLLFHSIFILFKISILLLSYVCYSCFTPLSPIFRVSIFVVVLCAFWLFYSTYPHLSSSCFIVVL